MLICMFHSRRQQPSRGGESERGNPSEKLWHTPCCPLAHASEPEDEAFRSARLERNPVHLFAEREDDGREAYHPLYPVSASFVRIVNLPYSSHRLIRYTTTKCRDLSEASEQPYWAVYNDPLWNADTCARPFAIFEFRYRSRGKIYQALVYLIPLLTARQAY